MGEYVFWPLEDGDKAVVLNQAEFDSNIDLIREFTGLICDDEYEEKKRRYPASYGYLEEIRAFFDNNRIEMDARSWQCVDSLYHIVLEWVQYFFTQELDFTPEFLAECDRKIVESLCILRQYAR